LTNTVCPPFPHTTATLSGRRARYPEEEKEGEEGREACQSRLPSKRRQAQRSREAVLGSLWEEEGGREGGREG